MKKLYTLLLALVAFVSIPAAAAQFTMANYTISPGSYTQVSEIEKITIHWGGLADGIDAHIMPTNVGEYVTITCGDEVFKAKEMYAGIEPAPSVDDLVIVFDKITKPGKYVLNIAEGIVKDYDQAETADEGEGYSINGPITATYTIPGAEKEMPMSVYTLDPASGSSVASIKKITVAFPETATRGGVDEYGSPEKDVTLTCGDKVYNAKGTNYPETDGYSTVEILFDEITEAGTYTLNIPAGMFKEFDVEVQDVETETSPLITATYTITGEGTGEKPEEPENPENPDTPKAPMSVYTLDPVSGSTLASIKEILISFPETAKIEGIEEYANSKNNITLTCGDKTYQPSTVILTGNDYTDVKIYFDEIKEAGTYTLKVAAGTFREYRADNPLENELNPEINATYTISGESGIDGVATPGSDKVTVVDIMGRVVLKDASRSDIGTLESGIYIINGKKTAVLK